MTPPYIKKIVQALVETLQIACVENSIQISNRKISVWPKYEQAPRRYDHNDLLKYFKKGFDYLSKKNDGQTAA